MSNFYVNYLNYIMENFIKILLKCLSNLYGLIITIRNIFFENGWIKSKKFDIPTICVGNIAVGGTGKTPHIEYLIRLLQDRYKTAILSRGYKRKTKGYILADLTSTARTIGDEPFQYLHKFKKNMVCVDENRCEAIEFMMQLPENKKPEVVLLDDAYQHRYVESGIKILLTEYHNLFCDDNLMPLGRLREPAKEKRRANIVIVTKCPNNLSPINFRIISDKLLLKPNQNLFFTTIDYDNPYKIWDYSTIELELLSQCKHIILITGIASPKSIICELQKYCNDILCMTFRDHHDFSKKDIEKINETFAKIEKDNSIIITTEKDASRLRFCEGLSKSVIYNLYALPIKVRFIKDEQKFNNIIYNYVECNRRSL